MAELYTTHIVLHARHSISPILIRNGMHRQLFSKTHYLCRNDPPALLKLLHACVLVRTYVRTWSNKVRELIAVKVLHTSLLNTTVVAFTVLPLGSYAPMPAPSPPFKTILELVLWDSLQSCRCIAPDVISVIKCLPFNIFFIFGNRKMSVGARSGE